MLKLIENYLSQYSELLDSFDKTNNNLDEWGMVPKYGFSFFISSYFLKKKSNLCVLCPSNSQALQYSLESSVFLDEKQILFFPGFENLPYSEGGILSEHIMDRVRGLDRILSSSSPLIVFTSCDALIRKLPEPKRLYANSISLKINQHYPLSKLQIDLYKLGYTRTERVEAPGDFCTKGSLLDFYPVNINHAIRLDYFDDTIEKIKYFDVETQKSIELPPSDKNLSQENLTILGTSEIVFDTKETQSFIKKIRDESKKYDTLPPWLDLYDKSKNVNDTAQIGLSLFHCQGLEFYFSLVSKTASLLDYFQEKPILFSYSSMDVKEAFLRIRREFQTLYEKNSTEQFCLHPKDLLHENPVLKQGTQNYIELSQMANQELGIDDTSMIRRGEFSASNSTYTPISGEESIENKKKLNADSDISNKKNNEDKDRPHQLKPLAHQSHEYIKISELRKRIYERINEGAVVVLTSNQENQLRRLASFMQISNSEKENFTIKNLLHLRELKFKSEKKALFLLPSAFQEGFSIPSLSFTIITDNELFGKSYQKKLRAKRTGSAPIESFLDLKTGAFVVHLIHGIGKFLGLEKVRALGRDRDFLVLEYADQDKLYVPLDQISMIQQYVAPTEKPRLDSLGKASFKKVKEKVQERVQELAKDLLRIQALRSSRKGYKYPPDTAWQQEFEALFPYTETPDQLSTIEAVKQDMESEQAMDRLICADVGFGKTEIAIRAIFKAVLSGKQVAFIAPTTILAWQHFQNLKKRYENYPISVDWVSRFRTGGEIKKIKNKLLVSELDVVVGTHALLSENMQFKNLGLLVIDEEQRFGVSHKEAIKRLRSLVDVITLTATPIPRTLHMALVGIRELSIMETPPQERLPVQTYVQEDRDSIIQEALIREKKRGGQSFFLHNRIATIESTTLRLQNLVPELNIGVLHGQMQDEEIEDVLMRFQEGVFDILVTTSIIENGIDIPNVNTLIVDRADLFGLSQLYQIRGRVGRSDRQAYAYFLYTPGHSLNEDAQKRLHTILEYQELGSGFKIAMRDLEIRGAGNVLGVEQSGHIVDVGYELYLKLLNEAIQELRGEKIEQIQNCTVQLQNDFYIPETYILDVRQRIEFYKRFEAARHEIDLDDLSQEMKDRFGEPDSVTKIFIQTERTRCLAQQLGFVSVVRTSERKLEFKIGESIKIKPQHLISCLQSERNLSIRQGVPDVLYYTLKKPENLYEELVKIFTLLGSKSSKN